MSSSILEKENKELNKLARINKDACEFYSDAMKQAKSPSIKESFRNLESLHQGIVVDLQQHIRMNGGDPEVDETLTGQAAQFWGELMAKISNDVDETLVSHLEEAEDRCLHSLQSALKDDDIRPETRAFLQKEVKALQRSHDYMKSLKDALKAA